MKVSDSMKIIEYGGIVPVKYSNCKCTSGVGFVPWNLSVIFSNYHQVYLIPMHLNNFMSINNIQILESTRIKKRFENFFGIKYFKLYLNFFKKFKYTKKELVKLSFINSFNREYINKIIEKIHPDVFHIHGLSPKNFSLFDLIKYKKNTKFITTCHGLLGNNINMGENNKRIPKSVSLRKEYENTAINKALNIGQLTTVSLKVKENIQKIYNINENKIIYIPNGVSSKYKFTNLISKIEKRKKLNLPLEKKIFLTVGSLQKRKNHILVLQSLLKLPKKILNKLIYLVIGDGPEKNNLINFCTEYKLNNVKFLGKRFDEELADLYFASDFFILFSKAEAMPLVFLEALYSGLPIITNKKLEGVLDLYNEKSFILSNRNDKNEIALIIEKVLNMNFEKHKISQLYEEYNWNNISHNYLKIMQDNTKQLNNIY
jgi:glycosyltransferase involved in cell wall biosynthesis